MVKNKIRKITKYLSSRLEANGVDVFDIILFGSQARGDAKKDSDIDLIIISKSFKGKNIFCFFRYFARRFLNHCYNQKYQRLPIYY